MSAPLDAAAPSVPEFAPPAIAQTCAAGAVDDGCLAALVGYHARRASLALVQVFSHAVKGHELKVVEFSMLSLIKANPGITNSALCSTLGLLPPNAVGLLQALTRKGLITKRRHLTDRRAYGLYTTEAGQALTVEVEQRLLQAEREHLAHLSAKEQRQLMTLLQKVYQT